MISAIAKLLKITRYLPVPILVLAISLLSAGQYRKSELNPPPAYGKTVKQTDPKVVADSLSPVTPVRPTFPGDYKDISGREYPADLSTPSGIKAKWNMIRPRVCICFIRA